MVIDVKVCGICLGCKVNTYENEFILSEFKSHGYEIVDNDADIYIINTCSVTNMSDAKSRKVINRCARENKNSIIVVMGCFIQANKDYDNSDVDIIIGNKDKNRVVSLVEDYIKNNKKIKNLYDNFDNCFEDMYITNMNSRTRAYVKIQDGCENFCSYCIIPYTRGKCRSKDIDKCVSEVTDLVKNSYKEIVLTGIHTGHYGEDSGLTLTDLLNRLVNIDGLLRLRISSIEITELDDKFLECLKNNKIIVNHMHIPLQAGSDHVLKLMNRKYDSNYYIDKINKIRSIRPDMNITTDVIVGFPMETEEDFIDTMEVCKKALFSKIHVFPYSRRKGTVADTMEGQINDNIKKDRVNRLINLSNELEKSYIDKFIGKKLTVLIETNNEVSIGHTDNFIKVEINKVLEKNSMVNVIIKERIDNYLIGEVYE